MRLGGLKKLLKGKGKYVAGGLLFLMLAGGRVTPRKSIKAASARGSEVSVVKRVTLYLDLMRRANATYPNVPIPVIATIMHIESGGDPNADNGYGPNPAKGRSGEDWALGLMQLKAGPNNAYWKEHGLDESTVRDPWRSVEAGTKILSRNIKASKKRWPATSQYSSLEYAIAAYHDGAGGADSKYPGVSRDAATYIEGFRRHYPSYANLA